MSEKVFVFGPDDSLCGVLTEGESASPDSPVVVFLNAGLTHHVGPHGLHVELARDLATLGMTSLRFDLTGKGDSALSRGSSPTQAVRDVTAALDALEKRRGTSKFILAGLCSGADDAYACSKSEKRIVGLFLIDGLGYRNSRYWLHHYVLNRLSFPYWRIWLEKKVIKRKARAKAGSSGKGSPAIYDREFPKPEEAIAHLQNLINSGVKLFLLYTGGVQDYYNYPKQFLDNFAGVDFQNRLRLEYIASADHTFSFLAHRRRLRGMAADWMKENFF